MVSLTGDMSPLHPDRNLALELVRATEAASIRAVPFIGRGAKEAADGAAVDAMRAFLDMGAEDRCLGFFVVAACDPGLKDSRVRQPDAHLAVEWRD